MTTQPEQPTKAPRFKFKRRRHKPRDFYRNLYKWRDSERRAIANALAQVPANARAVELIERTRPTVRVLVTLDTYPLSATDGMAWRASRFDEYGPSGHWNAPDLESAIRSLLGERVPRLGPPHGSPSQYRVARVL